MAGGPTAPPAGPVRSCAATLRVWPLLPRRTETWPLLRSSVSLFGNARPARAAVPLRSSPGRGRPRALRAPRPRRAARDAAAMRAPRSAGLSEQRAVRGPFRGPRGFGASSHLRGRGAGPQARCGSQVPRLHPGYEGAGTTAQSRRKNIIPNRKPAATAREIAVKGCRSIEVLSASPREEDASRT